MQHLGKLGGCQGEFLTFCLHEEKVGIKLGNNHNAVDNIIMQ